MQEISYKNNTILFNRIIVYGCSLTAGMELADTKIVPEYSQIQIDEYKRINGLKKWIELIQTKMSLQEIAKIENDLTWAKILADHYDVNYVNRATYGGNSASMIYYLQKDLSNNFITDNDLILVGHSEISRYFWINRLGKPIVGCVNGTDEHWPSKLFHQEFSNNLDYRHHMYNWYSDIQHLNLLSLALNGRLLQQYCYNTYHQEMEINNYKEFKIENLYSIIDEDYSFNSIVDWSNQKDTHTFTHPKIKFHEIFANHLIRKLQ
jgi:hypothetical protein